MNKKLFEVQLENGRRTWNLNAELRHILKPIAAEFGWTVEDFLTCYSRDGLPGQVPTKRLLDDADEPGAPTGFTAEPLASDPEVWERIQRAAKFYEQTPDELIWQAVWGSVRCAEDDMIVSPSDGRVIGDDMEIGEFEVRSERMPEQ